MRPIEIAEARITMKRVFYLLSKNLQTLNTNRVHWLFEKIWSAGKNVLPKLRSRNISNGQILPFMRCGTTGSCPTTTATLPNTPTTNAAPTAN
jgi:hypothetical protein